MGNGLSHAKEKKETTQLYEKRLKIELEKLQFIVFGDEDERGCNNDIPQILQTLRVLKKENEPKHQQIIEETVDFKQLFLQYPNWTPVKKTQSPYSHLSAQSARPINMEFSSLVRARRSKSNSRSSVSNTTLNASSEEDKEQANIPYSLPVSGI